MPARKLLFNVMTALAALTIGVDHLDGSRAASGKASAQAPAAEHKDVYAVIMIHTVPPQILIVSTTDWRDCQRRLAGIKALAVRTLQIRKTPDHGVISPDQLTGVDSPGSRIDGACETPPLASSR